MLKQVLFLIVFIPFISNGQNQKLYLSSPFNKLTLGKTTLKETKQILGNPSKRRVPPIVQHKWEKRIELDYCNARATFNFGYKQKVLYCFTLEKGSTVIINDSIKIGVSDTLALLKFIGQPLKQNPRYDANNFHFDIPPYDASFYYDENGIIERAYFFEYQEADTSLINTPVDTSKLFFGAYVRHVDDDLADITLDFIRDKDTVSVMTNKEGIAEAYIAKWPYPKLRILAKGYEEYNVQITDAFLDDGYSYNRINLISLEDTIFNVKHCNSQNIYSVDDTLKGRLGVFPIPDKSPAFVGGIEELKKYFTANSFKPKHYDFLEQTVSIGFIVTCEGKAGDFIIIDSRGGVFEIVAYQILDIVRKMPQSWQAATIGDTKIDCYQVLTLKILKGKFKQVVYK